MGRAATFTNNASLVPGQWQHRASNFPLHLSHNVEYEAGQAASTVFLRFEPTGI